MRIVPEKSEETQGAANAAKVIAIFEEPTSGLPIDGIATLQGLVARSYEGLSLPLPANLVKRRP